MLQKYAHKRTSRNQAEASRLLKQFLYRKNDRKQFRSCRRKIKQETKGKRINTSFAIIYCKKPDSYNGEVFQETNSYKAAYTIQLF